MTFIASKSWQRRIHENVTAKQKEKNTVKKLAGKKGNSSFNQQIKNEFAKRDFK